ncbi:MAG: hypothetical protein IKW83_12265 [Muribaculaceae bacterium]|nr:hypothetical protein [Muribaculaceae bacterium]
MNQSVLDELTALVDALRAETTASSITPERLGAIIQQIIDILPDLDDSDIANAAATALEAAQTAINLANSALSAARSAEAAAGDVADDLAAIASDVAEALDKALSAYTSAQSATTAAQQASAQVSQLASRVSTLESFKTTTESKLSKTPEYHSATWLDSEEGAVSESNPERRQLVRYTSMLAAIEGGKKLIKKYNIVASGIDVTNGAIILSFLEVDDNRQIKMGVYRVTRPSGADYCVVEKSSIPLPVYNANWALRVGGSREQLDELINVSQATPQVLIMVNSQPVVWIARRSNDVVQFGVMTSTGMRIYTVEYSSGAGETNTTYEDKDFIE